MFLFDREKFLSTCNHLSRKGIETEYTSGLEEENAALRKENDILCDLVRGQVKKTEELIEVLKKHGAKIHNGSWLVNTGKPKIMNPWLSKNKVFNYLPLVDMGKEYSIHFEEYGFETFETAPAKITEMQFAIHQAEKDLKQFKEKYYVATKKGEIE